VERCDRRRLGDVGRNLGLPDPDDEHVPAAAVIGGAGLIVTDNIKDFPSAFLPAGLETQSARDFTTSVASVDPVRAVRASQKIACRHQNPAHPAEDVLDLLVERYRMDGIADILRPLVTEPR